MNAEINTKILDILKPFQPIRVGVFGSYSRGEMNDDSDIDILYSFQKKITLFDLVGLKLDLEDALNRKIDLVSEKGINKYIKPYILKDLKIIYQE
ncbi:MAG: nucleotidyltransferase family protein [Flavobacteriaceae bacterium]